MDINEAILGRRSVREYAAQPVDERTIRHLINAAVHAPNAVNQQAWAFAVVRDQNVLDRISDHAKAHMRATLPANSLSDHFRTLLGDPDFHIFHHALGLPADRVPVAPVIIGHPKGTTPPMPRKEPEIHWVG